MRVEKSNLKNELNKALRVISREIGEDINIDQVKKEMIWHIYHIEKKNRFYLTIKDGEEGHNRFKSSKIESSKTNLSLNLSNFDINKEN